MMEITRELFDEQRHRRYGTANPERMRLAYWEWMVREGCGPYQVRKMLGVEEPKRGDGPDWCFQRMGATSTELPDGTVIRVGGEHEDWYDPDFCIYNDVVILGPTETIEIYGYPNDVFPPTDFHTATLIGDRILLIGNLGYPTDRVPGFTPVYSLDLATYQIERFETWGEPPGWIHKHEAGFDPDRATITVRGGETTVVREEKQHFRENVEEYRLHLDEGRWERITHRGWRQFAIAREDGRMWLKQPGGQFEADDLRPRRVPHEVLPKLDRRTSRFAIGDTQVRVSEDYWTVRILVEGVLPEHIMQQIVGDVVANLSDATVHPCRVLEL